MSKGLALLLAAGCLAGCSNLSCELPDATSGMALGEASRAAWVRPPRAQVRTQADDVDVVGSIPRNNDVSNGRQASRRPSEFILKDPKLFSEAEDKRPWPLAGSTEAKKQDEEDAKRDREISKVVNICHC